MNLYPLIIVVGLLIVGAVLLGRRSLRQVRTQQLGPDPVQDPADALNPLARTWQRVNLSGLYGRYEVRYALFFIALITGCLTFVRYEATGWYKYWPAHGVNFVWLYVLAALIGVGYASTRPGGWGRKVGVGVPVALFLGIIIWCGGLTTFDYFFGSAQERAAEVREEEAKKRRQAEAGRAYVQAAVHRAAAEAAGGAQCLDVLHKEHTFGTTPDESSIVNEGGRCYFEIVSLPPGACFYLQGRWDSKPSGPFGECEGKVPFTPNNVPRDVVKAWAKDRPFEADYKLRPRNAAKHGVVN